MSRVTYAQIRQLAHDAARETEHTHLRQALERHDYRLSPTADELGCAVTTLYGAVARYPDLRSRLHGRGAPRKSS